MHSVDIFYSEDFRLLRIFAHLFSKIQFCSWNTIRLALTVYPDGSAQSLVPVSSPLWIANTSSRATISLSLRDTPAPTDAAIYSWHASPDSANGRVPGRCQPAWGRVHHLRIWIAQYPSCRRFWQFDRTSPPHLILILSASAACSLCLLSSRPCRWCPTGPPSCERRIMSLSGPRRNYSSQSRDFKGFHSVLESEARIFQ